MNEIVELVVKLDGVVVCDNADYYDIFWYFGAHKQGLF